jgi:asparagine synthase (glutamine-hydrolysing)
VRPAGLEGRQRHPLGVEMCGIHGFTGSNPARLFKMLGSAVNRGPDGMGVFQDGRVSLGQNLLAIMDVPDNSGQPWRLDGGRGVLCFNGQIYNWSALADESGFKLRTRCDTELLARGLEAEGDAFLDRLRGMFAIAYYDVPRQQILLARDPGGMKPLYYREGAKQLAFSSELRSLLSFVKTPKLDRLAETLYFELGYVPGPRTLVHGVSKLTPGEWRRYNAETGRLISRGFIGRQLTDAHEFKPSHFRDAVHRSVAECAMGMRPVGLYLSGGIDSAMILHEARELGLAMTTCSTRFRGSGLEAFNEDARLAKELARHYGVEHHDVEVSSTDFAATVEQAIDIIEEPRYNRSTPAYYLTAQAMARTGAIVTMAGDGGDEALAGYPKYGTFAALEASGVFDLANVDERNAVLNEQKMKGVWRWTCAPEFNLTDPVHRWYYLSKFRLEERSLTRGAAKGASNEEILAYLSQWLGDVGRNPDRLNGHLAIEQCTWLAEDALIRNDKLGMAFGMEGRFPLVSRTFREYAMGIPSAHKIVGGKLKRAARWAYEGVLPDIIIKRPAKTGWTAPVLNWQENEGAFREYFADTLSESRRSDIAETLELPAIRESGEPKLQYAAFYLLVWAQRWGISAWTAT